MVNPLERRLLGVERPGRYIGGEYGAICKPWDGARLRWALAFPEVYEIGMSHLGLQILYHILNAQEGILADRVFAPWFDMEELLIKEGKLLWGLESGRSLKEFDILGITIPYELTYTNIVSILKLGGVPVLASERTDADPLVIGGGCGAFNPEPVAGLFDAILIGDGEEAVVEISRKVIEACHREEPEGRRGDPANSSVCTGLLRCTRNDNEVRSSGDDRRGILEKLSCIEGLYVPSLGIQKKIKKRTIADLNGAAFPESSIVPNVQLVHDRIGVEIQRGCTRGCRFCQAGMIYRPDRQRSAEQVISYSEKNVDASGFEECAFLSLSAGDYDPLTDVIIELDEKFKEKWVHISLPSLRTESLNDDVIKTLSRSLKGGFTLAPEAATERLRRIINKGNTEEDLLASVERIFSAGWKNLKLYFMIGLPNETDKDIDAIQALAKKVLAIGRRLHKFPNITVNVSTFIPKSHTPFQWERQMPIAKVKEIHRRLRGSIRGPGLELKLHSPEISLLEGIFSRGGRELLNVIIAAHQRGCRFDGWDDRLKFGVWGEVLKENSVDPETYLAERKISDVLPWDHLFADLNKNFLINEREKALTGELTPDCSRTTCAGCGVCDFKSVRPVIARNEMTKQSSESTGSPRPLAGPRDDKRVYRYCAHFTKTGDAIFIGHLDLMNIWRRALRRAGLPLSYSEGFNPRPRISFADALPLGIESMCEWCEFELTSMRDAGEIKNALKDVFPKGIDVIDVVAVKEGEKSAPRAESNKYTISVQGSPSPLWGEGRPARRSLGEGGGEGEAYSRKIQEFSAASSITIIKRGKKRTKEIDLKTAVISLAQINENAIEVRLKTGTATVHDFAKWFFELGDAETRQLFIKKCN